MDKNIARRPCRTGRISWRGVLGPSWLDTPHAITITEIAAACAALDYGYAVRFSHQIDEIIARDEEGNFAAEGRIPHKDHRGR